MATVARALESPWVEQYPAGVKRLETKRESFALTDSQKALFNAHWELETIQREKPAAPKQVDLMELAAALEQIVQMDEGKKTVELRMDNLVGEQPQIPQNVTAIVDTGIREGEA